MLLACFIVTSNLDAQRRINTGVLVIGGGTGGTAAGIQSARSGVSTVIVEEGPWLGGMISAAGVSATDGNHDLPSGIWKEFRDKIYKRYGGPANVETGWVSNTQFEPHVADSIFKAMTAAERKLTVLHGWQFLKVKKAGNKITGAIFENSKHQQLEISARQVIDGTELGDVIAAAGIPYSVGMEASSMTGESVGVTETNNIVQDLTYAAILKDFGAKADCTIVQPANYTPAEFDAACLDYYVDRTKKAPGVSARQMLDYGKLPNGKYMLNWPINGNDTYLNVVEMTSAERKAALEKAKQTTLRFIYFIQQQLGFKNLGLATDEFPTTDRLALMPYHREGRRLKGLVRFTVNNIATPFEGAPLYRTGVAVGDYPIDHHHKKNLAAPQHLEFYPVPSFSIPLGALIPEKADGIIVAEKGISVSNAANGTTRLQPCVMITGQAAGMLAATAVLENKQPRQVKVRMVQNKLLKAGAYLMPYIDVHPGDVHFMAIQKIGATGILKGTGIPYKWANQTWFYPDSTVQVEVFAKGLKDCTGLSFSSSNGVVMLNELVELIATTSTAASKDVSTEKVKASCRHLGIAPATSRAAKRFEIAELINYWLDPFGKIDVDYKGNFLTPHH